VPFDPVALPLEGGLVLRVATEADRDRLVAFNAQIHRPPDATGPADYIGSAVRRFIDGQAPGVGAGDFLLVEDPSSAEVASSLCVLRQRWSYAGIPFAVDQVEFVGTAPAYRRRGLVRLQFELVHRRARQEGCPVEVVAGIDWYYRQFGYEYALQRTRGGRTLAALQGDDPDQAALRARPATVEDIAFLTAAYQAGMTRYAVSVERDPDQWLDDLDDGDPDHWFRQVLSVIEDPSGRPLGFFGYLAFFHHPDDTDGQLRVGALELAPGASWATVGPPVLDCLRRHAATLGAARGLPNPSVHLRLGDDHPAYDLTPGQAPDPLQGYVWYVRVGDLPGFLTGIAPALEARLAASAVAGHSGTLALSFYRDGLKLRLDQGRLTSVERWPAPGQDPGDACFPDHTFLQLLFGYRSVPELEHAFPDCAVRDPSARTVLDVLFPRQPSYTWLTI
jgi:hypothetical protein